MLARNFFATEPVIVPDVVRMQEEEAIATLEEAGLNAEVEARFSPRPEGEVVAQDPEAGEEVQTGDTVTIFVSQGRRSTIVPDLRGMTLAEAEEALEDANLRVGDVTEEESDEFEAGQVIRHNPEADEEVPRGTRVDLVISAGPEEVSVPHVVGLMEEQARANIQAAGLNVEVTREPSEEEEGRVIAQDPEGGTEVPRGSTVRITVSTGLLSTTIDLLLDSLSSCQPAVLTCSAPEGRVSTGDAAMSSQKHQKDLKSSLHREGCAGWTFGQFTVDAGEGRLARDCHPVAITPKARVPCPTSRRRRARIRRERKRTGRRAEHPRTCSPRSSSATRSSAARIG